VGIFPQSVAVADLNHDGLPDLVTANAGSNDVSVLLGRGDGTFTAPRRFTVGTNPVSVAIGDLNGDLIPDLVTADPVFSAVTVLLGLGDGTFEKLQLGPPQ
jgi:VCBS repeat protein